MNLTKLLNDFCELNNIKLISNCNIRKQIPTDPAHCTDNNNSTICVNFPLYLDCDIITDIKIDGKYKNKIISCDIVMKNSLTSNYEKMPLNFNSIINYASLCTIPTKIIIEKCPLYFSPISLQIILKGYIPDPLEFICEGYIASESSKLTLGLMHWH
jgi:hypothetical protein